jgi:putative protease
MKGRENRIIWRLPFIIFEGEIPFYREVLASLAAQGFYRFEAANLAHFMLLGEIPEKLKATTIEISTDYRLFSLNTEAILAWRELGASAVTLYIEDDAENMSRLLVADMPMLRRVLVYGGVPVMTTKIRIKDVKGDAPLVSDRGEGYAVTVRDGLSVITAAKPFSLIQYKRRLQEMGCASFMVDLAQLSPAEWPRVLDAFARGMELPGTTEFNFTMGLV